MKQKKKVLIISIPGGSGHVRAAQAIHKEAQQNFPDIETKHIDLIDHTTLTMKKAVIDSYDLIVKRMPELWGYLYDKTDNNNIGRKFNKITNQLKKINSYKFYEYINSYKPDIIICTHFLPADIIFNAPKKYKFNVPVTLVLTDYDLHNLWLVSGVSHYFVATEKMKWKIMNSDNRAPSTLSGIPIDSVFFEKRDPITLKKKLNLPLDKSIFLVMSGGQGFTRSDKVINTLLKIDKDIHIIAITGKNATLKKRLEKINYPDNISMTILGWTDIVHDYVKCSDLIITKTGGLTTTECIACGKYIIATEPIPGQEERNAEYILQNNLGSVVHSPEDLLYYVHKYIKNPSSHKKNIPNGANKILKVIKEKF
ncbi:MAG: hypothetical protein GF349_02585 [Candidatus Magasanikbacteria bacterium]|nr:hypothetical protein [Candidatus Magasanikbacteria bacterium]